MRKYSFFGLLLLLLNACDRKPSLGTETREAWVPVYSTETASLKLISAGPARPTVNAGKIFALGNIIYQVETDSGIHVINAVNPAAPQKIGFIRCFLCREVTVKNNLIYTNNLSDLVVIDASTPASVREVARTADVFPDLALQYPPKPDRSTIVYFECPDPKKGVVVGWKKTTSSNANCRR